VSHAGPPLVRSTRSGFVAVAGRPNAGKSTLVNRIVGGKVAITSDKPQTTRREVRGIASGGDWQMVLVDLPGVQRPRDPMTERMQRRVEHALSDADAVLFLVNGTESVGPGERFVARAVRACGLPAATALNKVDRLDHPRTVAALAATAALGAPGEIFPVSARTGAGVDELVGHLVSLLPEGPFLYPDGERSDQPEHVQLAELVREQVLARTRDELPHAVEVEVRELEDGEDGRLRVEASLWAESESQKGILIGAGGRTIKAIGTAARKEIEAAIGRNAHLDLRVRVRKGWRRDDALLDRLGIE
jgi:GTPase